METGPERASLRLPPEARALSMDQCRGFAIVMMLLGNFMGKFAFMPSLLTHHRTGMTLAETIAPLFVFLAGMSYRGSFLRRAAAAGPGAARWWAVRRHLLIFAVGVPVYWGHTWDALTHIGLAGILLLPVIHRGVAARLAAVVVFAAVHQALFLGTGYGDWVMTSPVCLNGGPLAALTWGMVMLLGTVAWDMRAALSGPRLMMDFQLWGWWLVVLGVLFTLPWGGLKPAWPFTRYGMTFPHPLFTGGVAFLTYDLFYWFCDYRGGRAPLLSPLGRNPLVTYAVLGACVGLSRLVTGAFGDPSAATAMTAYAAMVAVAYAVARTLDQRGLLVRL